MQRTHAVAAKLLWVYVAVFGAYAFWLIIQAPRFGAEYQRRLIDEISDENRLYCGRWGIEPGTHQYQLCELDLAEIRAKEDERNATEW